SYTKRVGLCCRRRVRDGLMCLSLPRVKLLDGKSEFPIGNVRHEHVLDIYNKPEFRRLRTELNTRLEVVPCCNCGFL
ncbi:MAG: SPASM domain-containing protein, partial [Myxococcaceae bacterium]